MIPVYEPWIAEEEVAAVADAVRRGEISGTFGRSIEAFEEEFASYCGCKYGVSVTSGTTALHLAVAAADIETGSEILVSASTNIATALAAAHNRLVPVPVDSELETWNLDLDLVEELAGPRTRAIIPVHLFGHPVDMDRLMAIANRRELLVIEDCAEAHGATCRGRRVGSFGHMACFSFYANKIMTTGEGGMVVTDDAAIANRLRLLRNLGFTQPRFKHDVLGYNFRMTGYQAAMGRVQLGRIDVILKQKRRIAELYTRRLAGLPGLDLPAEANWATHVHWMYALTVGDAFGPSRDQVIARLKERGIESRTFFCPMNQQPCLQRLSGYRAVACPVADELWQTGLYLPSGPTLDDRRVAVVAGTLRELCHSA